jgi:hypothetical protein
MTRAELISLQLPSAAERRFALMLLGLGTIIFVALAPFAAIKLTPVPIFIPIYQAALFASDLATAWVLLRQYQILRLPGLLLLGIGYLFTAFIVVAHTLSFPGLFAPGGLMGSGPQTTAWLYMFWHSVFPLLVLAYALMRHSARALERPGLALFVGVVGALAAVVAFTWFATARHDSLPAVMAGNSYTLAMLGAMSTVWVLSLVALAVLWFRPPHSSLDLWMMVVMAAWVYDIGLAAALNGGRWDLGFYSGRIFGLVSATFVLLMLLREPRTGAKAS